MTQPPSAPPDARRRRHQSRATHDRLARAALELFTTRGYHRTTTPLIAARAGVAEGTIYRHFASKDELLNEVYRAGVRVLRAPVREALTTQGGPCRAMLDQVATRWTDVAAREPGLIQLVFDPSNGTVLDDRSGLAMRDFRADLEQIIAAGKAAGQVRAGAAELWADVWLRVVRLGLDRVAARAWRPDDPGLEPLRNAAWDAIRSETPGDTPAASSTHQGDRS